MSVPASPAQRRLHYLRGLGVPVYFSHRELPGALPSLRCLRPVAESTVVSGSDAGLAVRAVHTRVAATRAPATPAPAHRHGRHAPHALGDAIEQRRSHLPQEVSRESRREVGLVAPAETFQCSLAAVRLADRLWLEELEGMPLAREQVRLLCNMARAMGWPADQPEVQQFDWPLHNNPQLDQGREAACSALHAFVSRQAAKGVRAVVVLGEPAAALFGAIAMELPVLYTHASRRLLAQPLLKREVWRDLRGLPRA